MTSTICIRHPFLWELSHKVLPQMRRLFSHYAIIPFLLRFTQESDKLKKSVPRKDKQDHLCCPNVVYKVTSMCGYNYIGQAGRNLINRINEHNFDQHSEVCKDFVSQSDAPI